MHLIDSHAHLTAPELACQIDAVMARCAEAGVEKVITVGVDLNDAAAAIALSQHFPGRVHAAVGIHPHEAGKVPPDGLSALADLWRHPAVVAVGEIGLDYHYDFADRATQRQVFAAQLAQARDLTKPVVIHCRDAFDDTVELLVNHGFAQRPVVFHCFTGTAEEAERLAEQGWRISFTGIVTFRKSAWLQEIAKAYPPDQLMVETDAPYLSPEPLRGRRPNEPARVALVVEFLARLRGAGPTELADQTAENTRRFFGL